MTRLLVFCLLFLVSGVFSYNLLREYSGKTFFNDASGNSLWSWYSSPDNLTFGNVLYLDEQTAFSQQLAYINGANRAVLKVDNTSTVALNQNRSSVRITTLDTYDVGSLWIVDMSHVPYGCSLWPAFWSMGALWPQDGEIDIFEAINLQTANQMSLHTVDGCTQVATPNQTGTPSATGTNCATDSGCVVIETSPNSYGADFATAGGGVWAAQFDVTGIFVWFWSRPNIPASVTQANSTSSIDISQWGPPSASYPASACNITKFFGPQNIVFDITLCGDWAGVPSIYDSTCANTGPTGLCYNDNVVGNGSNYDNAYFEVSYLRTYTLGAVPSPSKVPNPTSTSSGSGTSVASNKNHASHDRAVMKGVFFVACGAVVAVGLLM